jgi:hypothetical protein
VTTCPDCDGEVTEDLVGGGLRNEPRTVLLCGRCWRVWPSDHPPRPVLHLVTDERRDLA